MVLDTAKILNNSYVTNFDVQKVQVIFPFSDKGKANSPQHQNKKTKPKK